MMAMATAAELERMRREDGLIRARGPDGVIRTYALAGATMIGLEIDTRSRGTQYVTFRCACRGVIDVKS